VLQQQSAFGKTAWAGDSTHHQPQAQSLQPQQINNTALREAPRPSSTIYLSTHNGPVPNRAIRQRCCHTVVPADPQSALTAAGSRHLYRRDGTSWRRSVHQPCTMIFEMLKPRVNTPSTTRTPSTIMVSQKSIASKGSLMSRPGCRRDSTRRRSRRVPFCMDVFPSSQQHQGAS
jgi:hypothetical protein